jgi:7,8-dihydropterin-6-yl-methyl-4-(beta-D-ribofuranosyl)aminobenzene 5'-phosphate synthase
MLFDTGSNGRVLISNMKKMKIDIREIEYLFISHSHWDHIWGIDSIIELNPDITMFVPNSLSKHLIDDLKSQVKEVVIIDKKPQRLYDNLYTTGLLGEEMPEQSLIIEDEQLNIITGCGHYGAQNIAEFASKMLNKKIKLILGGFHLLRSNEAKINKTIEALKKVGTVYACPTHCSGDLAKELFKKSFKNGYIEGGAGKEIHE